MAEAIKRSKDTGALAGKLFTYLSLKETQDSKKYGAAYAGFQAKAAPLFSNLAFFAHEIKQIDGKAIETALQSSEKLRHYEPWLDSIRRGIPHTPPLDVQRYAAELSPESGWNKLYDDRDVARRFTFEGKALQMNEIVEIFTSAPDRARRKAAHEVFVETLAQDSWMFAQLHNEIMRLTAVDNRWSNFKNPWDARHFSNNVAPEIVDALETAVKDSYARISHRFYALKAKLMGLDRLEIYDRNVNVFEGGKEQKISYDEAKTIVLDAYRRFMPRMADEAQKFFDNGWIDASPDENKRGGAFAHPGGAQLAHPMVMLNYMGSPRDVATMAHELGHGVHQLLAAHKGDAIVSTPLTFAETASVFGEMLTFKSLLAGANNDDERRKLLFEKVNDMINTVFRQISFYDFEKRINTTYRDKGQPLTEEEFGTHWCEALQDSYGDALQLDESYGATYGYIPHIVHTPFYVYAYAFGDALVNALYAVYEEGSVPDFEENYIKMLEAGGTLKPEDLQDMFGLDIKDPAFWDKGLQVIENLLDELETLCKPLLDPKNRNTNKNAPKAAP